MQLVGTVVIVNRLAQSVGCGSTSKLNRPCKGFLQVRNRGDGQQILMISTRKDVTAYEYNVKKIQSLRTRLIKDGFATIDISEPPMSVMLRDCIPTDLEEFMTQLKNVIKPAGAAASEGKLSKVKNEVPLKSGGGSGTVPESDESGQSRPSDALKSDEIENDKPGTLRKWLGGQKRARSPELSKAQKEKTKKFLSSASNVITVKKREDYPKEFATSLQRITVTQIGICKIDNRILALKHLTVLNLSENRIKSIEKLTKLSCQLKQLILANNLINAVSENCFDCTSLRGLSDLDLSHNLLTALPLSIEKLSALSQLRLNNNKLHYLPYNLRGMQSLRTMDVSNNSLLFIPATVKSLQLSRLDLSGNPATRAESKEIVGIKYVGYNDIPTLFESACEIFMNSPKQKQMVQNADLPEIVQKYLNAGKYCLQCGKLALRFQITASAETTRSICEGGMARCLICPVGECITKKILCYNCDMRAKRRISGAGGTRQIRPSFLFRL